MSLQRAVELQIFVRRELAVEDDGLADVCHESVCRLGSIPNDPHDLEASHDELLV